MSKPSEKYPRSVSWISIFGCLSALYGLYYSDIYSTFPSPYDRYHIFAKIFAYLAFPQDALLLITSIAILTPYKALGRRWILWWAVIATVYQVLVVLITMWWIAPTATVSDVPRELADMLPMIGSSPGQAISGDATFALISILFLTTWIGWSLTRPAMLAYFEPENVPPTPPVYEG
jgi:hypothetical protein